MNQTKQKKNSDDEASNSSIEKSIEDFNGSNFSNIEEIEVTLGEGISSLNIEWTRDVTFLTTSCVPVDPADQKQGEKTVENGQIKLFRINGSLFTQLTES